MLLDSATYSVPAFAISQWKRPLVYRKIGPCSLLISKSPQQQYHHVWLCICTRLHVSLLTCHASRRSLPAKSTMTKRPTRVTDCAPASSSPSWQSKEPNRRRYLVKLMVGCIQASQSTMRRKVRTVSAEMFPSRYNISNQCLLIAMEDPVLQWHWTLHTEREESVGSGGDLRKLLKSNALRIL